MNRSLISFIFLAVLLVGCSLHESIYKRFELPKDLDQDTQVEITRGIAQAMRSQPFVDELKKRFPQVTQAQLLKTDIRWDVVTTSDSSRSFFVSFGVKDTRSFPEAGAVVDFFLDYGKTEAQKLIEQARTKKKGA